MSRAYYNELDTKAAAWLREQKEEEMKIIGSICAAFVIAFWAMAIQHCPIELDWKYLLWGGLAFFATLMAAVVKDMES